MDFGSPISAFPAHLLLHTWCLHIRAALVPSMGFAEPGAPSPAPCLSFPHVCSSPTVPHPSYSQLQRLTAGSFPF